MCRPVQFFKTFALGAIADHKLCPRQFQKHKFFRTFFGGEPTKICKDGSRQGWKCGMRIPHKLRRVDAERHSHDVRKAPRFEFCLKAWRRSECASRDIVESTHPDIDKRK